MVSEQADLSEDILNSERQGTKRHRDTFMQKVAVEVSTEVEHH